MSQCFHQVNNNINDQTLQIAERMYGLNGVSHPKTDVNTSYLSYKKEQEIFLTYDHPSGKKL